MQDIWGEKIRCQWREQKKCGNNVLKCYYIIRWGGKRPERVNEEDQMNGTTVSHTHKQRQHLWFFGWRKICKAKGTRQHFTKTCMA